MTPVQRSIAVLLILLVLATALPALTASASAAPAVTDDATRGPQLSLLDRLEAGVQRLLATLGGFGGTGDDGMGLDPDGGGGGDGDEEPPSDDGTTGGGSTTSP